MPFAEQAAHPLQQHKKGAGLDPAAGRAGEAPININRISTSRPASDSSPSPVTQTALVDVKIASQKDNACPGFCEMGKASRPAPSKSKSAKPAAISRSAGWFFSFVIIQCKYPCTWL